MTVAEIGHLDDDTSSSREGLPDGWTSAQLKDGLIIDVQTGFACGQNNRAGEGIAHLRPMNVNADGQIDLSIIKYVPETRADRDERLLRQSDVLFNNTNSPELVGKTSYYNLPEPRAFSNHMTRLRCDQRILAPLFCAIALHQKWREGYFRAVCSHHVSQSSVSRNILLETPILLPPLGEQKRIVAKVEQLLARVNAARERLAKVPEILKHFRQSVLAAACSGRLTADWRNNHPEVEPASVFLKRIAKDYKGKTASSHYSYSMDNDIPKSWSLCNLGTLTELITKGASPNWQGINYVDKGILFVTSENVGLGHLILENKKFVEEKFNQIQKRSILKRGDILTNIVGASIGRTTIFDLDEKANINQAVSLIRLKNKMSSNYILTVLNSPAIVDFMNSTKVDVARANLSLKDVASFPIPLPPITEQQEIVHRVEALFKIADQIEERYQKARAYVDKLTRSILAKAFRGELVFQDPDDEPASELLKRIQEGKDKQTKKREKKVKK